MIGIVVVAGILALAAVLVLAARLLDRIRGIGPDDKWTGWYRGKTHDISQTLGYKGSEYDSMDDHGNREIHGDLR